MEIKCSRSLFLSESGKYKKESFPQFRPSSPCSVGVRGIGAVPALYPALQACGMTKRSGHGFTLIELLVVVLIMGILAAVALPQYNKAVKKAQGTEVLMALNALDKALKTYYFEHSTYGSDKGDITADELNIQFPVLKHFKYNKTCPGGCQAQFMSEEFPGVYAGDNLGQFLAKTANISFCFCGPTGEQVKAGWFNETPAESAAACYGENCQKYFSCRQLQAGTETINCFIDLL